MLMRYLTYSMNRSQFKQWHILFITRSTIKTISRSLKICIMTKTDQLTTKQSYCRKFINSSYVANNCLDKKSGLLCSNVCCRLYSSWKDDDVVKSWLNEIKDDFGKETKLSGKEETMTNKNTENESTDSEESETRTLYSSSDDDFDKLEKLGFTTEEIIDLLKRKEFLEENHEEWDHSDTENADSAKKSKESFETLDLEESCVNNNSSDQAEACSNNMEDTDWSVVKLKPEIKTDWSVVEIEDFVNIAEAEADVEETWESPVDLARGNTGVYDIQELIEVLRVANAQDVVTLRVPPQLNFADYMVITCAKSLRHLQAITSDVKWIYKRKKSNTDKNVKIEGEKSEWCALDLGNIVLHIFMPAMRELYDLETLWTVGAKFDLKCAEPTKDPYVFSVDDLPWLKDLEQASEVTEKHEET